MRLIDFAIFSKCALISTKADAVLAFDGDSDVQQTLINVHPRHWQVVFN